MCPRSTSINKCRAPRVSDDTLSARHYATECIYFISPGTKVWGSSAGHRSWLIRQPAAQSKLRELRQRAYDRYKGPLDHLLIALYACFVPVIRKTQNNRNVICNILFPVFSQSYFPALFFFGILSRPSSFSFFF